MGPLGAPKGLHIRCYGCHINSKTCQKFEFWHLRMCEMIKNKLGFRPRDPHGEIRAGILRRIPVSMSQMVPWRPIWWQKGATWGPLGFWAQPGHPWSGVAGRPAAWIPNWIWIWIYPIWDSTIYRAIRGGDIGPATNVGPCMSGMPQTSGTPHVGPHGAPWVPGAHGP